MQERIFKGKSTCQLLPKYIFGRSKKITWLSAWSGRILIIWEFFGLFVSIPHCGIGELHQVLQELSVNQIYKINSTWFELLELSGQCIYYLIRAFDFQIWGLNGICHVRGWLQSPSFNSMMRTAHLQACMEAVMTLAMPLFSSLPCGTLAGVVCLLVCMGFFLFGLVLAFL